MGISSRGQMSRRAAVFLDRDGVIVEAIIRDGKPYPPRSADQMRIVTDAQAAVLDLKAAGFLVIVVTNQPDVARGVQKRAEVEHMHMALRHELAIDDVLACLHDDGDSCSCRKPKPGLLVTACVRYGLDLDCSFMVGDRWRDIDAGHAAGCSTVLIDQGYIERAPSQPPTARVTCLREAVAWICSQSKFQEERKCSM
jgi:D-glycero-D-manno-heptose 1,7-bisphosphate phosphatase